MTMQDTAWDLGYDCGLDWCHRNDAAPEMMLADLKKSLPQLLKDSEIPDTPELRKAFEEGACEAHTATFGTPAAPSVYERQCWGQAAGYVN